MKLVAVPTKKEMKSFLEALKKRKIEVEGIFSNGKKYWRLPKFEVFCIVGGLGKTQFAISCQYWALKLDNVDSIISIGCGGALDQSLNLYDVVFAKNIVEFDFPTMTVNAFPWYKCSSLLDKKINKLALKGSFLKIGNIASGDENIVSFERADALRRETKSLAVGWEGAGGARVSKFLNIEYMEFRGISDKCNKDSFADFSKNLESTMDRLADLFVNLFGN